MSVCEIEKKAQHEPKATSGRVCGCCGFRMDNQFLSKCPRCAHPMKLDTMCGGCLKRAGCGSQ